MGDSNTPFLHLTLLFLLFSFSPSSAHTPPAQSPPPHHTTDSPPPAHHTTSPPPHHTTNSPPPAHHNTSPPPHHKTDSPPPAHHTTSPPPAYQTTSPPPHHTTGSPPPAHRTTSPPPAHHATSPPPATPPPPTHHATSPPPPTSAPPTSPPPATSTPPSSPPPAKSPPPPQPETVPPPCGQKGSHNTTFSFTKIFAFGDSFTDTGNADALGGLISFGSALTAGSPYGSTYFKKPEGRFCDGRLVLDFLAEKLKMPLLPAYKSATADAKFNYGANFAVAGSTSVSTDYYINFQVGRTVSWKAIPDNFQIQLDWFNEFMTNVECVGKKEATVKAEMQNALFWIGSIGGKDYSRTFGNEFRSRQLAKYAVEYVLKVALNATARGGKYIVVQGLPPLGCFPLDISLCPGRRLDKNGCSGLTNALVLYHNDLLQRKLKVLQMQNPRLTIIYADYWGAYQAIASNPAKYGFEETRKACCGSGDKRLNFDLQKLCGSYGTTACSNPSKYMHWDGVHLTEAMNAKLAELFFEGGFTYPSFKEVLNKKCN